MVKVLKGSLNVSFIKSLPDGSVVIIGTMNTVVRLKQEFLVYFAFLEKINLLCSQCHSMDEAVSEAEN